MEVDAVTTPPAQLAPVGVSAFPLQCQLARNDAWEATPVTLEAWAAHSGLGPAMKRVATFTQVLTNPILLVPWDGLQLPPTLSDAETGAAALQDSRPPLLLAGPTRKQSVLISTGHNQCIAGLTLGHTVITAGSRPVVTPGQITGFTTKREALVSSREHYFVAGWTVINRVVLFMRVGVPFPRTGFAIK